MKVGTIGYATEQGLGILTKSFIDAGVITDIGLINHSSHVNRWDWYPNAPVIHSLKGALEFCSKMDAMLFFETPFHWEVFSHCRALKIPTILMPMYECTPDPIPAKPDYFLAPSLLDYVEFKGPATVYMPVPTSVEHRVRERAEVFVHNAGHGGLLGRNGTKEFLEAIPLVKSDVEFILRSQTMKFIEVAEKLKDPRLKIVAGTIPYDELWKEGDVFVFPEKFNGLSLPLQEALCSGMLVMASARFPNTSYLPNAPLIPICGQAEGRVHRRFRKIQIAEISPHDIAATIDEWAGKDISVISRSTRFDHYAYSWHNLRPKYMNFIERVVKGENPIHRET